MLVIVAAVCVVLYAAWGIRRRIMQHHATPNPYAPSSPRPTKTAAEDAPPAPPDALLLRTETVPIAQVGNPAPMLKTRGTGGTAYWYRARTPFSAVREWYDTRLAADGWQPEPGHGAVRVYRRDTMLLWLADATDPHIWRRLTNPAAPPPRDVTPPTDTDVPTFTVLRYRTGAPPDDREPLRRDGQSRRS